ncbi:MAG TPA: M20/M25/M40 family metallo-hydrolase [Gemmatimonadales bacterium]
MLNSARARHVFVAALVTILASGLRAQEAARRPVGVGQALDAISEAEIRGHLRFLSHDLLQGRAPGTQGGRLAETYVAAQFERLGLDPAGDAGTFTQRVDLVGVTPQPALIIGAGGQTFSLQYPSDFVAWPESPDEALTADGQLVFVGYGITAPEWEWRDYDGPLTGKIALIMVNDPGQHDSSLFDGPALTYYGRWTYKLEQAARMGALGAILIHTDETATYPWEVVRGSWTGEQITLENRPGPLLRFAAWMRFDAARRTLAAAGRDLDAMMQRATQRSFRPMDTGLRVAVDIHSTLRRFQASNVIGKVTGSDSIGRTEAVFVTAHHDHKGMGLAVNGDSIYNGAEDNASGVALMLAAAQAMRAAGTAPRRSVYFLATTAEESGLLGAVRFVEEPPVALERIAAVINIDIANVRGRTRDISALGLDLSTLGDPFRSAAEAEGLRPVPDPEPERGSFFRSDHFPFAMEGVPVLSFRSGIEFENRPEDWGIGQAELFFRTRYHQPGDEFTSEFDLTGAVQQGRVMLRVIWALATTSGFPRWRPEASFSAAGERLRQKRERG